MRTSVPRLAIVIPAVGSISALESTLVSVLENRPADCEIVVVLNADYDDPYDLEGEVRFVHAPAGVGLVACANLGISRSRAAVIHLLACGCTVSEGWAEKALRHFSNPRVAAVAPLLVDPRDAGRVVAAGIGYRAGGARYLAESVVKRELEKGARPVLGACVQAAFYRRAALDMVGGGLSAALGDELADIDLAWALRHAGYQTVLEPAAQVIADGDGHPPRRTLRQALFAERMFWRNAPSVGWARSLACHPLTVAAEFIRSLPRPSAVTQLVGRFVACCQMGAYCRHYERLKQLAAPAVILPVRAANEHLRIDASHARKKTAGAIDARSKTG